MPYNEHLAQRVREKLSREPVVEEKRMMGGLTFMVNDKMCLGILNDDLMVRLDPAFHEQAMERSGCREMDFTGKAMKGFVFVDASGTRTDRELQFWVDRGLEYNARAKSSRRKKKS